MSCSRSVWETQLEKAKAALEAWSDAELALAVDGGVLSYTLDTGQGRQTVTRRNLGEIRATINNLANTVATLEARLYGCGTALGRPRW
mgnify:CR=1 FL=1|jgi:hypothetical protein